MSDSDLRRIAWASALALGGASCSLVLDLDAEGGDADGGGGDAITGAMHGGAFLPTTGAPRASSAAATAGGGATTASASTGPATACDGHATFDGSQFFRLTDDDALDLEKNFAIQARIRPEPPSPGGVIAEGAILSRLSESDEKGYELVVFERHNDGLLYPELRLYLSSEPCRCEGSVPVVGADWARVAAGFSSSSKAEATVWVDDVEACRVECDGNKLSTFSGHATLGRAMEGGAFYRGAIAQISVRQWNDGGQLDWEGACTPEPLFVLGFDHALPQTFAADCASTLHVTFGSSGAIAADDPQLVLCP